MMLYHIIVLLGILSLCHNYKSLSKYGKVTFYPEEDEYVMMSLYSFSTYESIYIKMTTSGSIFTSYYFYYKFYSSYSFYSKYFILIYHQIA